jgi:hypothetical protein
MAFQRRNPAAIAIKAPFPRFVEAGAGHRDRQGAIQLTLDPRDQVRRLPGAATSRFAQVAEHIHDAARLKFWMVRTAATRQFPLRTSEIRPERACSQELHRRDADAARRGLIDRMSADRSRTIREVPSWQVRPNGVMSVLSASRPTPDQMARA